MKYVPRAVALRLLHLMEAVSVSPAMSGLKLGAYPELHRASLQICGMEIFTHTEPFVGCPLGSF